MTISELAIASTRPMVQLKHTFVLPMEGFASRESDYLEAGQNEAQEAKRVSLDSLDVVLIRNDPSDDTAERAWAQTNGILFGQPAAARGTLVLNDPFTLAKALNQPCFQHFLEQLWPRTCISRDIAGIKSFIAEQQDKVVIEPLPG